MHDVEEDDWRLVMREQVIMGVVNYKGDWKLGQSPIRPRATAACGLVVCIASMKKFQRLSLLFSIWDLSQLGSAPR